MAEELWKVCDNSWAPTTDEVSVDTEGPEGYGKVLLLVKRPSPDLDDSCFKAETRPVPDNLKPGTVLVNNTHYSMDPTHFIWAQDIPQYMPAVGLGTVMRCLTLGNVVKTTNEDAFPVGTVVTGFGGVAEYSMLPISGVSLARPDVPVEQNLGPFSMLQGHTAWVGTKICGVQPGLTMVVSGAAGAVGSFAGQLGKKEGSRVVGIAGGPEKCKYVVNELGFDACIDYKNGNLDEELARLCPKGIDSYFDNVGGPTLDAVVAKMNCFGKIAVCGVISQYKGKMGKNAEGFKNLEMLLMRRLTMQGFITMDHMACHEQAMTEISAALEAGTLKWKGDVRKGEVGDYVKTINLLLEGDNLGKLILKTA